MKDGAWMRLHWVSGVLATSLVVAPLAFTAPASSEELSMLPVKTPDRGSASQASADGAWFGWTHTTTKASPRGRTTSYLVQHGDKPRLRVNPKGTTADDGGIYRQTLVYAQWRDDEPSDLYRYDLQTGRRTKLPAPVNTQRASESDPTLSGRYLLFTRQYREDKQDIHKVMLYDRRSQTLQKLDGTRSESATVWSFVHAGQVNGRWAVWASWSGYEDSGTYRIFRYDIRRDVTKRAVRPFDGFYSAPDPAVSSDGTVYFARRVELDTAVLPQIVKKPLEAPAEVVHTMAPGEYSGQLYVDDRVGARHVYFTAYWAQGIYKLVDPLP